VVESCLSRHRVVSLVVAQCRNGSALQPAADGLLLIPGLLEYGSPSHDVWPDNPEWEERQITCDFGVRVLRPGLFSDLVVKLNSAEGRRMLRVVADPLPVFLSHHAVFFAAVDQVSVISCCDFFCHTVAFEKKTNCWNGIRQADKPSWRMPLTK